MQASSIIDQSLAFVTRTTLKGNKKKLILEIKKWSIIIFQIKMGVCISEIYGQTN